MFRIDHIIQVGCYVQGGGYEENASLLSGIRFFPIYNF